MTGAKLARTCDREDERDGSVIETGVCVVVARVRSRRRSFGGRHNPHPSLAPAGIHRVAQRRRYRRRRCRCVDSAGSGLILLLLCVAIFFFFCFYNVSERLSSACADIFFFYSDRYLIRFTDRGDGDENLAGVSNRGFTFCSPFGTYDSTRVFTQSRRKHTSENTHDGDGKYIFFFSCHSNTFGLLIAATGVNLTDVSMSVSFIVS